MAEALMDLMDDVEKKKKYIDNYYFQEKEEIICGQPVSSILNEYVENYPSVVDRFFTRYFYKKSDNEYYLVLFHSNRICCIGLAPNHPALEKGVKNLSYNIGNTDRSNNKVSGKGKKGGMILQEDSTLAILVTEDDEEYKIPSCIRGKLIEVNERVLNNFDLLKSEGDGYIAVILPKIENCEEIKKNLLNEDQFNELNK